MSDGDASAAEPRVRLDLWLWRARFFRTRTIAATAARGGALRINGARIRKPGHGLKLGDVITIARPGRTVVAEVAAFGERRGPAAEAAGLYIDRAQRGDAEH